VEAIIFDLWDTLVPLPAQVRAAAIERRGEALDLPIANLRDALAATWTRRATGLLRPVIEDIYRERLGRSPSPEQIATALRARREVNARHSSRRMQQSRRCEARPVLLPAVAGATRWSVSAGLGLYRFSMRGNARAIRGGARRFARSLKYLSLPRLCAANMRRAPRLRA
jgi:hypothetical protein